MNHQHTDPSDSSQPAACAAFAHMANYELRNPDDQANRDDPSTATAEVSEVRVWSGVVNPRGSRADQKNHQTALRIFSVVRWSTPISYSTVSREEKRRRKTCLIVYRYEIGVDRLTTCTFPRRSTAIIVVNPIFPRVDHPDHPTQSTLDHVDVEVTT